jgi:hypothetical protein
MVISLNFQLEIVGLNRKNYETRRRVVRMNVQEKPGKEIFYFLYFICEGVFIVHNSHSWAWDNPHAISEHGYQVCFTIGVWAEILGKIVMGLSLLPAQWFHDFKETVLLGLLEDMPLALWQRLWFQHNRTPVHYGGDVWHWLNATCHGTWISY